MSGFEFATASRIVFGTGKIVTIGDLCKEFGTRACVVTGSSPQRVQVVFDHLEQSGITTINVQVSGEPSTDTLMTLVSQVKEASPAVEFIVACGGGSVIDAGKALAAIAVTDDHVLDYLEVIGKGRKLDKTPLPFIAVPTTSGTGAEVTKNAVLTSVEHEVKVSLRSNAMLPNIALVDPSLTYSAPPAVTASTGLDAFTQVIEPFVSHLANPITDALCREGIRLAAKSLRKAYENGSDEGARSDMSLASLLGGLALANAKLGAVHGFAGPVGGLCGAPHGIVCARFLPHVIDVNVRALRTRDPGNPAIAKFDEIGRIVTGNPLATAKDAVVWIQELCSALNVPPLSEYGLKESQFDVLVDKASRASSMKGNPVVLSTEELRELLEKAI